MEWRGTLRATWRPALSVKRSSQTTRLNPACYNPWRSLQGNGGKWRWAWWQMYHSPTALQQSLSSWTGWHKWSILPLARKKWRCQSMSRSSLKLSLDCMGFRKWSSLTEIPSLVASSRPVCSTCLVLIFVSTRLSIPKRMVSTRGWARLWRIFWGRMLKDILQNGHNIGLSRICS